MTPLTVAFRRLTEVAPEDLITLQNHPLVRRTLPLAGVVMDVDGARRFVAGKERLWAEHGYGPWAFFVDGTFAGWGGLQPEGMDADLGLVLHPAFWGLGKQLIPEFVRRAFDEWGLPSVTVLLPEGFRGGRAAARFGFTSDGELRLGSVTFVRHRLLAEAWLAGQSFR